MISWSPLLGLLGMVPPISKTNNSHSYAGQLITAGNGFFKMYTHGPKSSEIVLQKDCRCSPGGDMCPYFVDKTGCWGLGLKT